MRALIVALAVQISTGLPTLAGTWTLDAALSDPPEQVARELREFPPTTLTISQTNSDVTIAGEALHAGGKADTRQVEGGSVERTTNWEGPLLVVREKVGHAGTLRTTYSIVTTTGQLLVRVNFERDGQLGPFEIRLVYDHQ